MQEEVTVIETKEHINTGNMIGRTPSDQVPQKNNVLPSGIPRILHQSWESKLVPIEVGGSLSFSDCRYWAIIYF